MCGEDFKCIYLYKHTYIYTYVSIYIYIYFNVSPGLRDTRARWRPRPLRRAASVPPARLRTIPGRSWPLSACPGPARGRSSFPPATPSVAFGSKSNPSAVPQGARKLKREEKTMFFDDSQFPLWVFLDVLRTSPVHPRATLGPTQAPAELPVGTLGASVTLP